MSDADLEYQHLVAQGQLKAERHQSVMSGIRLGRLKLGLEQDVLELQHQERLHEMSTTLNQSLDAPDPDDDRNIRPVYEETYSERQIQRLERQLEAEEAFQLRQEKSFEERESGRNTTFLLVGLIVLIAWSRNFKGYGLK